MKQLLMTAVMIIAAAAGKAQLVYDFAAGDFVSNTAYNRQTKRVNPVKNASFARMKVINVNTFRYKVELSGSSVKYVTPIPSELQAIFRLSAENFSDENLVKALRLADKAAESMKDKAASVTAVVNNNPSPEGTALKQTMGELVEACEEYVEIAKKVAGFKYRKMELITASKQKWSSHADMLATLPPALDPAQMRRDYEEFTDYYATAYSLYEKAKTSAEDVKKANPVALVPAVVPAAPAATEAAKNIAMETEKAVTQAEKEFEKAFDLFAEDNLLKLIEDITLLQQAMAKEEYFTVESGPIQIDGDYMEFLLKITPQQVNNLMPFENGQEKAIQLPVKGGLKVDFSVGPTLSFGNRAKDDIYYTQPAPTDSVILKRGTNGNVISPGIAAMMHFGPRSGKEVRLSGMFGVGAGFQSANNANFTLYGGASLVFGKQERMMLSAGIGFLRVDRLKEGEYEADRKYPATGLQIGNVTSKVYQRSFFIALSYNLTNRLDVR